MSGKSEPSVPLRRIVLVGFMGSGKSTVGRLLARRLRWRFIDVDARIEARAGCSIAELFEREGEAAFRSLEDEVATEALAESGTVVATGGGWPVREDRMGRMPPGSVTVWLRIDAETAVRRASRRPGTRPLLDVPDPLARARELLAVRDPEYGRADIQLVSAGASPDDMVRAILHAIPDIDETLNIFRARAHPPPRPLN